MNMYSLNGHLKRLTGAFFLADIQTMTYQVHRYLGHASMFLLTLHRTMSHSVCCQISLEAWTFGYVQLLTHSPGIALMELMDIQHRIIQHRILLIELMDIQHWQTG